VSAPIDPDEVRRSAAAAAGELSASDAQDLVDGLRDALDE
jgi:hypothetical protein